ncbi:MAG: hypothetical protein ORN57_03135, partial [Alphaproteobacteria bacterium]|nr:hypothetical protein [Alphaproteobacteria bacterium]
MKKILLASTAMRCLLRRGNEKTHYSYNSKRKVNDKAGGRLVVAGMVSLGLWAMADPAVAVGGRDLLTNLNGKEEHNSGDRLPISLPNDYYTDNKNNISNHHPRQLALVTIDHIRGAKQPVKEQAPAVSAPAPQQQQVDKQQQTVKKQQAGQQQQTVKKQQANQQQQTVKKILPLKQQQGAQKRVLVNNADDSGQNNVDTVVSNDLVVTSAVKLITPPVNTGMSRNGFYIRPEGEAILTYGTFTNDGKMGIGAGGSVFMGYRYAPNGLSAGHLGFELGGGFFMPRVDKANSAVGAPSIFGENVATAMAFGADTNRDVGGLSFGNKTNMVSRSDVVTGSFVNGLTQATTRSDAGLVAVSSANGLTVMISQGMTQAVLDSRLNVVVTNSQNMSFFNATGKTIGVTSSQVVSNFQKSDISSSLAFYGSVQGAVTSTLVWGVTMTEGAAVQGRFPSGTYVFLGGDYRNQVLTAPGDSPYSHTIAANSSGTIVIGNVVTGAPVTITSSIIPWSSDLVAIGVTAPNTPLISSFQATPVIGHLAGSPTLAISDFNVYQSVKTYITGVRRDETYQVSDTRVIDTTTGFNISETVAVKVHLNKTETAASKQVTETTVVDYDRVALPSASANKRVIADSKENYIPITVGINYSLPMGNSGFGFTMG